MAHTFTQKKSMLRPPTKASASLTAITPSPALVGATAPTKSGTGTTTTTRGIIPANKGNKENRTPPSGMPTGVKRKVPPSPPPPPSMGAGAARSLRTRVAARGSTRVLAVPASGRTSTSSSSSRGNSAPAAKAKVAGATGASGPTGPLASKKRADWDYKGRLLDLEACHQGTEIKMAESHKLIDTMTSQLEQNQETIQELKLFRSTLETTVHSALQEKSGMAEQLEAAQAELQV
jgi:hypothetical protein